MSADSRSIVVEPYAVSTARPIAMPSMRATVTTDDATPNAARPAASTAAVERGVTDRPNPRPKTPSATATARTSVVGFHIAIAASPPTLDARPARVTTR